MSSKSDIRILLGHGGGGKLTGRLVKDTILPKLNRGKLSSLPDSVVLNGLGDRIAYTTDSYTVSPVFFPGGNIGSLAIHGTCNDLACSGARPTYLSLGLILEEGLPMNELDEVLESMSNAADEAGVEIVTGDTKVVPKGGADRIFINTSGIGKIEHSLDLGLDSVEIGDEIIVSGPVGNHGMAVMLSRAEFSFDFSIRSDSASIWPVVERLLQLGTDLKFLRDPTRGGIAATLNEIASGASVEIAVDENSIPVDDDVRSASEILGIDPLLAANEGKVVAVVKKGTSAKALDLMAACGLSSNAKAIGRVISTSASRVIINTKIGGSRILSEPSGELLPRIC